jgi:hypothetical protein
MITAPSKSHFSFVISTSLERHVSKSSAVGPHPQAIEKLGNVYEECPVLPQPKNGAVAWLHSVSRFSLDSAAKTPCLAVSRSVAMGIVLAASAGYGRASL